MKISDDSPRIRAIDLALRAALGMDRTRLFVLEERGHAVRLSVPNGFGEMLVVDVSSVSDAVEYARGWVEELGIGKDGFLNPLPGMLATVTIGSDEYGGTVEMVSASGKTVYVSTMAHTFMSFRRNKHGRWASGNYRLHIGTADTYLDPSF